MDDFVIEKAVRSNIGLFIGLAGGTGSGKTYTAMRIASGIVGKGKKFGIVDTENKRASHYADDFDFEVINFPAPFSSARYEKAVMQMFQAGYGAIVVDSVSHEHDGYGGYLDSQHSDLERRIENYIKKYPNAKEWEVREKLTPSSWVVPKMDRKRMMQTFLSCSSTVPIIFCFRAEEKVFASEGGKLVARKVPEWEPICGKGLPFEMTVFLMMSHEKPGVISKAIKLPGKLKDMFPFDKQLGEESGQLIAKWAKGEVKDNANEPQASVASPKEEITLTLHKEYNKGMAVKCPAANKLRPKTDCDKCESKNNCEAWGL